MKIRNLVAAVVLACAALAITSSPASANHTEFCAGQGTMTTTPLYYPGVGPSGGGGNFYLATSPATTVCTGPNTAILAAGSFGPLAYCEHWTGVGTINGHSATFVLNGSILTVTGNVLDGVFLVIPDVFAGQSCLGFVGATRFIVTGYVNFVA